MLLDRLYSYFSLTNYGLLEGELQKQTAVFEVVVGIFDGISRSVEIVAQVHGVLGGVGLLEDKVLVVVLVPAHRSITTAYPPTRIQFTCREWMCRGGGRKEVQNI